MSAMSLTPVELAEFRSSVEGSVAKLWPSPRTAGEPDAATALLHDVWTLAVAQGWTDLAGEGMLAATMAAVEVLGGLACPLPLLDVYVTARAFQDQPELV